MLREWRHQLLPWNHSAAQQQPAIALNCVCGQMRFVSIHFFIHSFIHSVGKTRSKVSEKVAGYFLALGTLRNVSM